MKQTKLVAVNEKGRRIGESHPRARLTDAEVDLIRQLAEPAPDMNGRVTRLTAKQIAEKFEISVDNAKSIISFRRRAHTVSRLKRVPLED